MYQLTQTPAILRTTDGTHIPDDPANTDYADYLQWLEDGNTPMSAPVLPLPVVETPALNLAALEARVRKLEAR